MRRKNWELKGIFWIITLLFVGFLAAPILLLLGKSLVGEGGFTWEFYASVVTREGFLTALGNSFAVAAASAVTATVIAFLMAYAVHYTGLPRWAKRLITAIATLPMFLPTITYGFAQDPAHHSPTALPSSTPSANRGCSPACWGGSSLTSTASAGCWWAM